MQRTETSLIECILQHWRHEVSDLNGNGVNDGEPGMDGWTIQLSKDGQTVNSTTTSKDEPTGSPAFTRKLLHLRGHQSGWIRTAPKRDRIQ